MSLTAGARVRASLARGRTPYYVVAVGAVRALNALGIVIVARKSTPETFGRISLLLLVAAVIGPLLNGGLEWTLARDAITTEPQRGLLREVFWWRLLSGVGFGALCAAVTAFIWPAQFALLALIIFLQVAADGARSAVVAQRVARGHTGATATAMAFGSFTRLAALVIAALGTSGGPACAGVIGLGSVAASAQEAWQLGRVDRPWTSPRGLATARLLRDNRDFLLVAAIGVLYARVDGFVVGSVASIAAVATWGIWLRVLEPYLLALGALQPMVLRRVAADQSRRPLLGVGVLIVGASVPLAVAGPFLARLVFGPQYEGLHILRLAPLMVAAAAAGTYLQALLVAMHRTRGMPVATAAVLIVNVIADIALIDRFGLTGAAVATIGAQFLLVGALGIQARPS